MERAADALKDVVSDLRSYLATLHGMSTEVEPLVELLKHIAADPYYTTMVNIELETNLTPESNLSSLRSGHVVRVVNEAMSNVLRHARAHNVRIRAMREEDLLIISIKDDGNGFVPGPSAGHGLQNMRDRARLLNGTLEIDSKIGKGTQITLKIPWED